MTSVKSAWLNLILAPIWFLLAIIVASIYFGAQGIEENNIPVKITENVPTIILCVQILLLSTLYFSSRKDNFNIFKKNWHVPKNASMVLEICFGVLTGISIAVLYIFLLSPLQLFLQNSIGDYVPAGETMNALGKQTIIFFVANVIFAPFVEESLYRNYALSRFLEKYSPEKAIFLNTLLFGLLHWTGGAWYILLTGIFVGLPFALIAAKRKNLIWVFVAHFSLNLIEFYYIYQTSK